MKIGLVDHGGLEISYPGYFSQDVTWSEAKNGEVYNSNEVWFAFAPVGTRLDVYHARLWDAARNHIADLRLTAAMHISEGVSARFGVGNLRVDELVFSNEAETAYLVNHVGFKLPTNCKKCNLYNEYVGLEHMTDGEYICRSCKR